MLPFHTTNVQAQQYVEVLTFDHAFLDWSALFMQILMGKYVKVCERESRRLLRLCEIKQTQPFSQVGFFQSEYMTPCVPCHPCFFPLTPLCPG